MKRKKLELAITIVIYIMTAFLSSAAAIFFLRELSKLTPQFREGNMWMSAVMPAVLAECLAMVLSLYNGQYSFQKIGISRYFWMAFKATVYFVGVWGAMLLIQKNSISESRYFFVTTVFLHIVIMTLALFFVQRMIIRNFYKTGAASLVAIIARREDAPQASDMMKKDWSRRIAGIMIWGEEAKNTETIDHIPVIAYGKNIVDCVRRSAIDEVFIFISDETTDDIKAMVEEFAQMGIPVHVNLSSVRRLESELNSDAQKYIPKIETRLGFVEKYPMAIFERPEVKLRFEFAKRILDILGGAVGAIVASILFIVVGIAIKLDSAGPIIFSQERIGKNGRRFRMFKFRSMYQDAEARKAELMKQNEMNGLMFKMKDDPRITKVGKFIRRTSIDEFPQFFNVLLGDMSLVGTRPPTVNEFNEYSNYHKRRLSMKPGITGMWQVSGRSEITDFEDVVKLDCQYIDNWSLSLDFKILVKTVMTVVLRKGSE
ncbi:hypothetical protein BXO88_01290 [Oribacterium sp. C9]|uniref:sugar transferase n=1 Tax=Oribacterium sp. C9 TaxID=1943579 RepID=UPI0009D2898B|nr:sugar transferase [Oribacterium sp. C9]OON88454.1 hypothetical protein BXO88_01290 [Oribacterium sp. C9]